MLLSHSLVSDVTLMLPSHSLVSDVTTGCLHDYVMWQLVAYMTKSHDNKNSCSQVGQWMYPKQSESPKTIYKITVAKYSDVNVRQDYKVQVVKSVRLN